MKYLLILLPLMSGCYVSHTTSTSDASVSDSPACVELGSVGCLIDRPCWCYIVGDEGHCRTCQGTCNSLNDDCFYRSIGGGP